MGGLVPISVPELRRLLGRLTAGHPVQDVISWSRWRRQHQAVARDAPVKRRRAALGPKWSLPYL